MSSFFERNKKKSLLAALLLLLKRGKGVIALLILVAILSGVFVLPSGSRIPWASKTAEKLGFPRPGGASAGLTGVLRSARESSQMQTNMGQEKKRLMEKQSHQGDSSTSAFLDLTQLPKFAKIAAPTSVSGVVNPDQMGRRDGSLRIDKDQFISGLVKSAEAGVIAGGGQMGEMGKMADGGKMADPGKMAAMAKGSAVNQGEAAVDQALEAAKAPPVPGGDSSLPKGEYYGSLTGARAQELSMKNYSVKGGENDAMPPAIARDGKPTFFKLAEARAYSVTAAPPTCQDPGCPKEFAHTTSAIVFDGQDEHIGKIMSSSELNESTSPNLPRQEDINSITNESMTYYNDTQTCDAWDAWANGSSPSPGAAEEYGKIVSQHGTAGNVAQTAGRQGLPSDQDPVAVSGQATERRLMREMQQLSCAMSCTTANDFNSKPECTGWQSSVSGIAGAADASCDSCDQGACDKTKAQRCKAIGNRMRSTCKALKAIWELKHNGCKLANGTTFDFHDCDQ